MGNMCSETLVCDCACTRTTRSSAVTAGSTGLGETSIEQLKMVGFGEGKAHRVGRTRSHSLEDAKIVDHAVKLGDFGTHHHKYNLRRPMAAWDAKPSTSSAVPKPGSCHNPQSSSPVNNQIVLVNSLERLSLSKNASKRSGAVQNNVFTPERSAISLEKDVPSLPKHVLYYGWFFQEETSILIHTAVMYFFRFCYNEVPQFQRFMQTCCMDASSTKDPFEYYKRPAKRVKPNDPLEYHITAKFLGREADIPYQTLVHPFLGKTFYIHLIGIVFTPRTLGVRVKLTPAQKLIFDEKEESRSGRQLSKDPSLTVPDIRKRLQTELDGYARCYKTHKKAFPTCKLKTAPDGRTVTFQKMAQDPTIPQNLPQSRAHITIGCAPNVKAKQTGDDLVDLVDLEQRTSTSKGNSNFQQDFKVKRGILRQFGKHANAFVFYADTEMLVPGNFNVFI